MDVAQAVVSAGAWLLQRADGIGALVAALAAWRKTRETQGEVTRLQADLRVAVRTVQSLDAKLVSAVQALQRVEAKQQTWVIQNATFAEAKGSVAPISPARDEPPQDV